MIDQYNNDRTGWARFGDGVGPDGEPLMRYHLVRLISDDARRDPGLMTALTIIADKSAPVSTPYDITAFLMCNPSDATAFKPDPTVTECVKFTKRWSSDITWVVNMWALRSPYPEDLRKRAVGFRGDDAENDRAILIACSAATRVVAAWGNHGVLDGRSVKVMRMLSQHGIKLHHLGTTLDGHPKHPLARGKHRIQSDQQPIAWEVTNG